MESGYKVYDVMTSNPIIIDKDSSIMQAAEIMSKNKVASLVIKENDKFLGLITERDITRKVAAKNLDSNKTIVKDIMSSSVRTIHPKADINEASSKIAEIGQKQLPVIDENGHFVGLLTFKDIMRVQPQLFGLIYEKYNIREMDRKPIHIAANNEGICSVCGNYSFNLVETEDSEKLCNDCKNLF